MVINVVITEIIQNEGNAIEERSPLFLHIIVIITVSTLKETFFLIIERHL